MGIHRKNAARLDFDYGAEYRSKVSAVCGRKTATMTASPSESRCPVRLASFLGFKSLTSIWGKGYLRSLGTRLSVPEEPRKKAICTWGSLYRNKAICTWGSLYRNKAICTWGSLGTRLPVPEEPRKKAICTWGSLYRNKAICTWGSLGTRLSVPGEPRNKAICTWGA